MESLRPWLLVLLLPAATLGPGLLLVRRLRWSPAERLVSAVFLSLTCTALATWAIYVLGLPTWSSWLVGAGTVIALIAGRGEMARLLANRRCRQMLAGTVSVMTLAFALLLSIRHYSGGIWAGDFMEHYERAAFFIERPPPLETTFLLRMEYSLTARPPLMNVLSSHLLTISGLRYDLFQAVFTWLNALAFLPLALLTSLLGRRGMAGAGVAAALVLLNPSFAENSTLAWTKLFAAFHCLLGTYLYVRGLRAADRGKIVMAFACLACGILVHYSSAVYALVAGLHFTAMVLWQRSPALARTWVLAAGAGSALLATWFAWALAVFGWSGTLGTNTTVTDSARLSAVQNLAKIGGNLFDTLVPHWFRAQPDALRIIDAQESTLGWWRDFWFIACQGNLLLSVGLVAGPVALLLAWRTLVVGDSAPPAAMRERRFWVFFVIASVLLGIAAVGSRDELGLAHVCLQPVTLLALAFLAARWGQMGAAMRWMLVVGSAIDAALGILLHFRVQALPVVFEVVPQPDGSQATWNAMGLTNAMAPNWFIQERLGYVFLGDHVPDKRLLAVAIVLMVAGALLAFTRSALRPPRR